MNNPIERSEDLETLKTALTELLKNEIAMLKIAELIELGNINSDDVVGIHNLITSGMDISDIDNLNSHVATLLKNTGFLTELVNSINTDELSFNKMDILFMKLDKLFLQTQQPTKESFPYYKELTELKAVLTINPVETLEGVLAAVHTYLRDTDLHLPDDKRNLRHDVPKDPYNVPQYVSGMNFSRTNDKANQVTFKVGENTCAVQINELNKEVYIFMDIDYPNIMLPVAF